MDEPMDVVPDRLKELLGQARKDLEDSFGLSPEMLPAAHEAMTHGEPLYSVLGISRKTMDARYALACQLYSAHSYHDAEILFRWLCAYDSTSGDYQMGLGAVRQALGDYEGAVLAYQTAAGSQALADPAPFYYLGICSLRLSRQDDAVAALTACTVLADPENAAHLRLKEMAQAVLDGLAGKTA